MEIRIIGPGCARCARAYREATAAVAASGLPVKVVKVEDVRELLVHRVVSTPAVVVDGVLRSAGRVPAEAEVLDWLLGTSSR